MHRKEREKIAEELNKQEQNLQTAIDNFNGNPETLDALKSVNNRIKMIEEALNLDI